MKSLEALAVAGDERDVAGIDVERHVDVDHREVAAHARHVGELGEVLLALGGLLPGMGQNLFERAVLLHQLRRGLCPDTRHAGEVVARIANHPAQVRHERRHHSIPLQHHGRVVPGGVGYPPARGKDADEVVNQLQCVPVTGEDGDPHASRARSLGKRADDVVGLKSRRLHVDRPEGLHQRPEVRHLRLESLRSGTSPRFVFGVDGIAEGRAGGIPRHDDPRWPLLLNDLDGHRREPIERVGGHTIRPGDGFGECEEGPKRQAEAIDEKDLAIRVDGGVRGIGSGLRGHASECIGAHRPPLIRKGTPVRG